MTTTYNINIVGNLTNNNGILSGFSANDYAYPSSITSLSNSVSNASSWEFQAKFRLTNTSSIYQHILGGNSGGFTPDISIYPDNRFRLNLSSNGNSYNICEANGTHVVDLNTDYIVKLEFTGSQYVLSYSTNNGTTFTDDIVVNSSTKIRNTSSISYLGCRGNLGGALVGSINLNESYLKVSNQLIWEGTTVVPEPTADGIIKLGTNIVSPMYLGSNEVQRVYIGNILVYNSNPPSLVANIYGMTQSQDGTQVYSTQSNTYLSSGANTYVGGARVVVMFANGTMPTNTDSSTQYSCGYIEVPYSFNQLIHGGKQIGNIGGNYQPVNTIIFGKYVNNEFIPIVTSMGKATAVDTYTRYCINASDTLTYTTDTNYNRSTNSTHSTSATVNTTTSSSQNVSITNETQRTYGSLAQIFDNGTDYTLVFSTNDLMSTVTLNKNTEVDNITHARIVPNCAVGISSTYPFTLSEIGVYDKQAVIDSTIFGDASLGTNLIEDYIVH